LLSAQFNQPWGIDIDDESNIYVADRQNSAIRKINIKADSVTTVLKNTILTPTGLRVNKDYFIIADEGRNKVVKYSLSKGVEVLLNDIKQPYDVTFDHLGNIFATDQVNKGIKIITTEKVSLQLPLVNDIFYAASILLDKRGNLFIGDYMERKVFMIVGMVPEYIQQQTYFTDMRRFLLEQRYFGSTVNITVKGTAFNLHKEICNLRGSALLQI